MPEGDPPEPGTYGWVAQLFESAGVQLERPEIVRVLAAMKGARARLGEPDGQRQAIAALEGARLDSARDPLRRALSALEDLREGLRPGRRDAGLDQETLARAEAELTGGDA
ncbi:MAG: hypothetical protein AAGN46_04195 [Acidobacteriota bacterium]